MKKMYVSWNFGRIPFLTSHFWYLESLLRYLINGHLNTNTENQADLNSQKDDAAPFPSLFLEGYKHLTSKGAMATQSERNTVRIYWTTDAYFDDNNKYKK